MGREATGEISFGGQSRPGKLLLEAEEVIARGTLRLRLPRSALTGWQADEDGAVLVLKSAQGALRARLGAHEVAAWLKALDRPVPGLAQKLGLAPDRPAWVIGPVTDAALAAALKGARADSPASAALALAELPDEAALDAALAALDGTRLPFWAVAPKGRASPLPDATLRARMRAAGWTDSKSCAVSDRMTATRYHRRADPPHAAGA